jgi:hypothetical protein
MLDEKQINRINRLLKDETFNYTGDFLHGIKSDIDYKIELLGYREMISVGTKYPYMRVKVIVTDFRDNTSNMIFKLWSRKDPIEISKNFMTYLFPFRMGLISEISGVLQFFDSENYNHVTIDDFEIDYDFTEVVTEQKRSRQSTRQVVRDIVNILKTKTEGIFLLPEDEFYEFKNYPTSFSVEVDIEHNNSKKGYSINADYDTDDDIVTVTIICNPKTLSKDLYDMVGELNEIITHELQHGIQSSKGELDDYEPRWESNLDYYLQPHEIEAQIKGFRRISNLTKTPFKKVVKNWFKTHEDFHNLTPEEEEIIINKLIEINS